MIEIILLLAATFVFVIPIYLLVRGGGLPSSTRIYLVAVPLSPAATSALAVAMVPGWTGASGAAPAGGDVLLVPSLAVGVGGLAILAFGLQRHAAAVTKVGVVGMAAALLEAFITMAWFACSMG
jgi:hypothetical protein